MCGESSGPTWQIYGRAVMGTPELHSNMSWRDDFFCFSKGPASAKMGHVTIILQPRIHQRRLLFSVEGSLGFARTARDDQNRLLWSLVRPFSRLVI